jgi:hypothetical protein
LLTNHKSTSRTGTVTFPVTVRIVIGCGTRPWSGSTIGRLLPTARHGAGRRGTWHFSSIQDDGSQGDFSFLRLDAEDHELITLKSVLETPLEAEWLFFGGPL